jgi:hypothetical protein
MREKKEDSTSPTITPFGDGDPKEHIDALHFGIGLFKLVRTRTPKNTSNPYTI